MAHRDPVDVLGPLRELRIVRAQVVERFLLRRARRLDVVLARAALVAETSDVVAHGGELFGRRITLGLQRQAGSAAARPGADRVRGDDLARPRDDRVLRLDCAGRDPRPVEVVRDEDAAEQADDSRGGRDDVRRAPQSRRGVRKISRRGVRDHDVNGSVVARPRGDAERRVAIIREHALGERAEHGFDGLLESALDLDRLADEATDALTAAGDRSRWRRSSHRARS